jgi:hypothetical protein
VTDTQKTSLRIALADAQARVKGLVYKAGANQAQRYSYVGHEDVIEHVRTVMIACGIIIVPTLLRFVQELSYRTKSGDNTAWLWEQTFQISHAYSDDTQTATVQVTTTTNDKASFIASTAADRTLLMRLMRLAGTSVENPEDDSHDEGHRQQSGGGPVKAQPRAAGNGGQPRAQNTNAAGRVVQQLVEDLNKAPADRETLANFYEYARGELAQCGATEQQKIVVQEAFGKRCASAGLKPREVISGRAA